MKHLYLSMASHCCVCQLHILYSFVRYMRIYIFGHWGCNVFYTSFVLMNSSRQRMVYKRTGCSVYHFLAWSHSVAPPAFTSSPCSPAQCINYLMKIEGFSLIVSFLLLRGIFILVNDHNCN